MDRRHSHPLAALPRPRSGRPRGLALAGLALAALLPGGCATTGPGQWIRNGFKVGPNYLRPPAPVAPEWIQAKDPRIHDPSPPDGAWWNVFQDTLLSALIAQAHQQNP